MAKDWEMEKPAIRLCDLIPVSSLPHEILKLENATACLIVDIDGVDYALTMQRVPKQRPRPH